jgi:hypothetical protein
MDVMANAANIHEKTLVINVFDKAVVSSCD